MFRVDVDSLDAYLAFDPDREHELRAFDEMMRSGAPRLTRYFHQGTPPGEPGMRFRMIGYGRFHYLAKGKSVEWPVIGLALQKNYISAYVSPKVDGRPVTELYSANLGATRVGDGNFSFVSVSQMDEAAFRSLVSEAERLFFDVPESMAAFDLVSEHRRRR